MLKNLKPKYIISDPKKDDESLIILDVLRGIAALYVMFAHARWILWEGYGSGFLLHPNIYNIFEKFLVYFLSIFKFGHFAVIFFFILSGFVIHLKQAKNALIQNEYALKLHVYLKKRILRIYPPFIFSLFLTFCLDSWGRSIYPNLYNGDISYTINFLNLNPSFDIVLFLKNLFFLQNGSYFIWGSNTVVWSLQMEWWFYIIYPMLIFICSKSFVKMTILVFIISFISIALFDIYSNIILKILSYFFLWWCGALFAELYVRRILFNRRLTIFMIFFLIPPFVFKLSAIYEDLSFGLGVCGLISILFYYHTYFSLNKWVLSLAKMSKFSYSLYLIHFPVFMLIAALYMKKNNGILPSHFNLFFIGILIALLLSYVVYLFAEKPFIRLKNKSG